MSERMTKPIDEKNEESPETQARNKKAILFDNIAKGLTLLVAFLIWLYVCSTNDATMTVENTFDVIPVTIIGTEEMNEHGLAVQDMSFYNLNITLKGTRSALGAVSSDNLAAYIDLSDITEPGVYVMTLKYSIPSGVALSDSMKKEEVEVTVDTVDTKTFTVDHTKIFVENFSIDSGCEIDYENAKLNVDYVKFEAPTMLLEKIVDLRVRVTGTVSMSASTDITAVVEALDADGAVITDRNLKTTTSKGGVVRSLVNVSLPLLKQKNVMLTVKEEDGIVSGSKIMIASDRVIIKGEPRAVDAVTSLSLGSFSLKEKTESVNGKVTFTMTLTEYPDGISEITKSDGTPFENGVVTATIYVDVQPFETLTVPISYCTVVGGKATVLDDSLTLKVGAVNDTAYLGLLKDAIAAGRGCLTLAVNVAGLPEGRATAPVTVVFSDPYSGKLYEIFENGEPYTVTVTVAEAE